MSGPAVGLVLYLVAINAVAFLAMALDKRRAFAGERRLPERALLQLAAIGGSAGAVAAQQLLRHKTRKRPFRTWLWLIAATQAMLAGVLLARAG